MQKSARLVDYLKVQLSEAYIINAPAECPYDKGTSMLFCLLEQREKCQPPFETDWRVTAAIINGLDYVSQWLAPESKLLVC